MSIYDDMRLVAADVTAEFAQGEVRYVALTKVPGVRPDKPSASVPLETTVNATVRAVSTKYVDGEHIVQSDRQVWMPNDGNSPQATIDGSIKIDGVLHKIVELIPKPAAGTPIGWTIIVRK